MLKQKKKQDKKGSKFSSREKAIFGPELSFAGAEAYKLLRANVLFTLPEHNQCRVIGITSAKHAEGKSTTAINLAYMLAETDKKVLLLDADMRMPSIARKLQINPAPGLSNLLAGQNDIKEILQNSNLNEQLHVIAAGDIPPNPTELLGSKYMDVLIYALARNFDFVVLDLPPVGEVSDALTLSKCIDGMIITVRQNYCTHKALEETKRQLEFAGIKILGFVMTRTTSHSAKY